jgi:radical SAM protein with 4Fe4S-binding SPASM domain
MYCAACSYNKIILYPNNTVARCENHLSQRLPVNLHNELTVVKYNGSDCTSCKAADLCGGGCLPDMNIDYLKERWCRLSKGMYEIATDGEL